MRGGQQLHKQERLNLGEHHAESERHLGGVHSQDDEGEGEVVVDLRTSRAGPNLHERGTTVPIKRGAVALHLLKVAAMVAREGARRSYPSISHRVVRRARDRGIHRRRRSAASSGRQNQTRGNHCRALPAHVKHGNIHQLGGTRRPRSQARRNLGDQSIRIGAELLEDGIMLNGW
jgi:hypothetical protein